jgi:hypothetical protein
MDYVIAIPTWKRVSYLRDKTLAMLRDMGIDPNKIYIFVANREEFEAYEAIDPSLYYKMIIGVEGLVQQRRFIDEYFEKDQYIVSFDDDFEKLDLSLSKFADKTLDEFFHCAYDEMRQRDGYIWGIYPVYNPFWRAKTQEITDCLTYIEGGCYGYINRKTDDLNLTISQNYGGNKEDVERSILYFLKDGKTVRFNRVAAWTKCYGKIGGLGTFNARITPMLEASKALKEAYGEMGRIKTRKNGMTEFVLANKYKNKITDLPA